MTSSRNRSDRNLANDESSVGEKFWLESPLDLVVSDFRIIPRQGLTLEQNMNAITRITVIILVILALIGYKQAGVILLLVLVVIVIIYYREKRARETDDQRDARNKKIKQEVFHERYQSKAPREKQVIVQVQKPEVPARRRIIKRIIETEIELPEGEEIDEEDQEVMIADDDVMVAAPVYRKSKADTKKVQKSEMRANPRRPYPPTVPSDMMVKASRYSPKNEDEEDAPIIRAAVREGSAQVKRQLDSRAYNPPKTPTKRNGFRPVDFQDQETENIEVETAWDPNGHGTGIVREGPPKRRFMPSNYEPESYIAPEVQLVNGLTRFGAKGGRKPVANRADANTLNKRADALDMMYGRAEKEQSSNLARSRLDRESQFNTLGVNG